MLRNLLINYKNRLTSELANKSFVTKPVAGKSS